MSYSFFFISSSQPCIWFTLKVTRLNLGWTFSTLRYFLSSDEVQRANATHCCKCQDPVGVKKFEFLRPFNTECKARHCWSKQTNVDELFFGLTCNVFQIKAKFKHWLLIWVFIILLKSLGLYSCVTFNVFPVRQETSFDVFFSSRLLKKVDSNLKTLLSYIGRHSNCHADFSLNSSKWMLLSYLELEWESN